MMTMPAADTASCSQTPLVYCVRIQCAANDSRTLRDLSANGARVYWVLLPHNDITWREHDTRMNGAYLAVRPAVPTVGYIDWRHTIISGRNGAPIVDAPIGPGGALEPVRGADGRHFSADASHVLADVMAQTVLEDYGINAAS